MGSLERRIEDLERLYNLAPSSEEQERRLAERRVEMHALMQDAEKRAEREAAAGDTRRQRALAELEERIKRRRGRTS